jgi:hypothetical protein
MKATVKTRLPMISPTPQTQQAIETTLRKIIHKAPVIDRDRLNDLRDREDR